MVTIHQIIRKKRFGSKSKNIRTPALEGCPHKKVTVVKLRIMTPRKPNSARRKIAKVKLKNGKIISAYLPGEDQMLSEYAVILIRGGRTKDLPGLHYKVVVGLLDSKVPTNRKKKRSRFGIKKSR